jgi:iron complex outermembrane receptor protein
MGNYTTGESQLYAGGSNLDSLIAAGGQAKSQASNVAVYAQLDKKLWERLNVTLGGRWEYFSIGGRELEGLTDNKPVFRAGLNYRVHKATYIRASFGQGFRFPTIAERYIETTVGGVPIVANPALKAETAWNAEGGIKQGIKLGRFLGYLDVAGFVQQYSDYVEFIAAQWRQPDFTTPGLSLIERTGLAFRSTNTNSTRVSGLEVTLLGQGKFTDEFGINVLAGYTWARPIALEPEKTFAQDIGGSDLNYMNTSTDTTNYILKYRYENLAKADIELNYKKLSVGVSFRYYSFMQNVDAIFYSDAIKFIGIDAKGYRDENDTPEYIVDFRISYEIAKHSKLAFIINNLNNREYALRPLVMDPPRSFALQYSLTL